MRAGGRRDEEEDVARRRPVQAGRRPAGRGGGDGGGAEGAGRLSAAAGQSTLLGGVPAAGRRDGEGLCTQHLAAGHERPARHTHVTAHPTHPRPAPRPRPQAARQVTPPHTPLCRADPQPLLQHDVVTVAARPTAERTYTSHGASHAVQLHVLYFLEYRS